MMPTLYLRSSATEKGPYIDDETEEIRPAEKVVWQRVHRCSFLH
jgi:hypothetical protein